jgi:hypothetical protein
VTETRTKANRRPIVAAGAFCDIDQHRLARIDSIVIVIIAGMHRRGRVAASVNPYPPNAGDGGARAATSFVANFKRSEDAEDEFGRDAAHVATQATRREVQWRGRPTNASDHELATTRFLASLVTSQRKIEVFSGQLCGSSIWMQISAAWRATRVLTGNNVVQSC